MTHITREMVTRRLEEHAIPYGVLTLHDDVSLVIAQRGGRSLGPFLTPEAASLFWINPAFASADAFRAFLDAEDWNLGGERVWIAPEIQYSVRDRSDVWGSMALPPAMDPGTWALAQDGDGAWTLAQSLTLEAHNLARGQKRLHVRRRIAPAADPLRALGAYPALIEGVTFAGYSQTVTLTEVHTDAIMSESWNLVQLNPGGEVLIPCTPGVEYSDYFEPVDAEHQTLSDTHVRLRITGQRRYKVGYKAAQLFGRLGYVNRRPDGRGVLIVRNFFNDPSSPYVEEPAHCEGCRGHAVHVYNDGGMFGGFGELECNGRTIGGETGRSASTDAFILWLYAGPEDRIAAIARHLLGAAPS
jgi:hypothetical protein